MPEQVKIVKQEAFKTTAGVPGFYVLTESEHNGKLLRQTAYFFGSAETKYVFTCSTAAEGGAKLDPLFEQAMKTFRFEKPALPPWVRRPSRHLPSGRCAGFSQGVRAPRRLAALFSLRKVNT
jgi:hypothetical protein